MVTESRAIKQREFRNKKEMINCFFPGTTELMGEEKAVNTVYWGANYAYGAQPWLRSIQKCINPGVAWMQGLYLIDSLSCPWVSHCTGLHRPFGGQPDSSTVCLKSNPLASWRWKWVFFCLTICTCQKHWGVQKDLKAGNQLNILRAEVLNVMEKVCSLHVPPPTSVLPELSSSHLHVIQVLISTSH